MEKEMENTIKVNFREMGCKDHRWIEEAQDCALNQASVLPANDDIIYYLKIDHDCFLPNPFSFTIYYFTLFNLVLHKLCTEYAVIKHRNKLKSTSDLGKYREVYLILASDHFLSYILLMHFPLSHSNLVVDTVY
jgi:hypothetical protein